MRFTRCGLILSGLNSTWEPLHPDKKLAHASAEAFEERAPGATARSAGGDGPLFVPGRGRPAHASPNWITCPWPPHYSEMLKYQWEEVGIPYWRSAAQYAEAHGIKIGMEMHPGMLVYNVETLLRMREVCAGWRSVATWTQPPLLERRGYPDRYPQAGDAIVHCHGKDSYVDQLNIAVNGCNDGKSYGEIARRRRAFRSIGYGHDAKVWKDIISAAAAGRLRLTSISIEHEDAMMSIDERAGQGGSCR